MKLIVIAGALIGTAITVSAVTAAVVSERFARIVVNDELVVRGGSTKAITIIPTAANMYAPIKWVDRKGCVTAMIVAHEETSDRSSTHNHLSIYSGGKAPAGGGCAERKSVIDVQFGTDDRLVTVEDARLRLRRSAKLELQAENGRYFQIAVTADGELTVTKAKPVANP